jgi:hypothetical protein
LNKFGAPRAHPATASTPRQKMSTNVEMVALDDDDSDENTFQRNETANSSTAAKTIPVAIVERTKANPADVDVEMQKKPQATAAVAMSVEVDDSENFTGDFLDRVVSVCEIEWCSITVRLTGTPRN